MHFIAYLARVFFSDGKDTELKVLYKILEYEELKDSSDFTMDDWVKQAQDIKVSQEFGPRGGPNVCIIKYLLTIR